MDLKCKLRLLERDTNQMKLQEVALEGMTSGTVLLKRIKAFFTNIAPPTLRFCGSMSWTERHLSDSVGEVGFSNFSPLKVVLCPVERSETSPTLVL
jgi:hypothetical protein